VGTINNKRRIQMKNKSKDNMISKEDLNLIIEYRELLSSDNLNKEDQKRKMELENELQDTFSELRKIFMEDIMEDMIALKYIIKYSPFVVTDDFLQDVVKARKFAIQHIPEELISDDIKWIVIKFKEPRLLQYIITTPLTDEMDEEIVNTWNYTGIKYYLSDKSVLKKLSKDNAKKIILRFNKQDYKKRTIKSLIPTRLLEDDEISELLA
jgi:hypothetical protein